MPKVRGKPVCLSARAKLRLAWIDFYFAHGECAELVCRHFGISKDTFYRWRRRFDPRDLSTLEERSRRPRRTRTPTTPPDVIDLVLRLRDDHPEWSKYKIAVVAARDYSMTVSASTAGRILSRHGRIDKKTSVKRRRAAKRPKRPRWPRELVAQRGGDLVQIDTKHLWLPWGEHRYQFVAIDVATKMKVAYIAKTISSRSAAAALELARERFPFQIRAVQTDNGSEFASAFEAVCEAREIAHFFTYPNCPKQNAVVERAIQTEIREFYLRREVPLDLDEHREAIAMWDRFYNEVRPHQSLGYLTPMAYHQAQEADAQLAKPTRVPVYLPA